MKYVIIFALILSPLFPSFALPKNENSEIGKAVLLPLDLNQNNSDLLGQAYKNTEYFIKQVFKNADIRNSTTTPPSVVEKKIADYLKYYKVDNLKPSLHNHYSSTKIYNSVYITYLTQLTLTLRKDLSAATLRVQALETKEATDKANNPKMILIGLAAAVSLIISLIVSFIRK